MLYKEKVPGTNVTKGQMAHMSKDQQERVAKQAMKGKLAQYGLSEADIKKMQSGNMSEAEQQALANKMMQNMTGGMTMQDVQFMQNMTDAERAQFMQMSGLAESGSAKIQEQKPKLQKNAKIVELVQESTKCDKQFNELKDKLIQMKEDVLQAGRTLFNEKYQQPIERWKAVQKEAFAEGALSEKYTEADKPKVEAANRKLYNAQNQEWYLECEFYEKYLPTWRDYIVKKMDICRAQLLPLMQKKKTITDKLYQMTKEPQYASGATYPYIAAVAYMETPLEIEDYGPFFDTQQ